MRWRAYSRIAILVICAIAGSVALRAQSREAAAIGKEVDIAEIDRTLKAIDVDRTSGTDGERQSAAFLERKLSEYGIRHTRHDMKAYLSWPVSASLSVSGASFTIFRAVTPAFSASTGPSGVSGELVFLPPRRSPDDDDPGPLAPDVRGKIVVAPGMISPETVQ